MAPDIYFCLGQSPCNHRRKASPLVAATIRAVSYLVPDLRPFLAPDEGPRADDAKLAGQVALLAHLRQG